MKIRYVVAAGLLGMCFFPWAHSADLIDVGDGAKICTKKRLIAYFNGVRTLPDESLKAALRLERDFRRWQEIDPHVYNNDSQLDTTLPLSARRGATRFYNPTAGALDDFAESFKQAMIADQSLAGKWETLVSTLAGYNQFSNLIGLGSSPPASVKDLVLTSMARKVMSAQPELYVDQFAKRMNDYMDQKVAVTVVAHSQGNFFADAVYKRIKPRLERQVALELAELRELGLSEKNARDNMTVKFYHIAPPVAEEQLHGKYFTNTTDNLIDAVRKVNPKVVPGNLTYDSANLEPGTYCTGISLDTCTFKEPIDHYLRHGFLTTYMNNVFIPSRYLVFREAAQYKGQIIKTAAPANIESCTERYP